MQIAAQINQEQVISKDLTLWNQQGSQVLRGQMLVLPVGNTFLYVDPIYIQATEGKMPQLKKVVLATGSKLVYADTYEDALAQLSPAAQTVVKEAVGSISTAASTASKPTSNGRLDSIRQHLQRYRSLMGQGKWSEAGKELEGIEREVK